MNRRIWTKGIYSLTAALIVACFVVTVVMVRAALQPYYSLLKVPERLQQGKLDYYLTSETHTRIFDLIHAAALATGRDQYDSAETYIEQARKLDPGNAIFSYMLADICYRSNDYNRMWKHIRKGNDIGAVRIYGSQNTSPESWTHPEISSIRHMATVMPRGMSTNDELWELIRMSDLILWCEPADVDVVAVGLAIREIVANRLYGISVEEGDSAAAEICRGLIEEKSWMYSHYREYMIGSSFPRVSIPTMMMAMATYRRGRNSNIREALIVENMERQAEDLQKLRKNTLKIPVLKTLEASKEAIKA